MTTPIDISELERLEREAAIGPWEFRATKDSSGIKFVVAPRAEKLGSFEFIPADCSHKCNGEFIVASRNALPELIASLKIAVEALEKYRGIAGSDCANSVTQYSAADEALAEIGKKVRIE